MFNFLTKLELFDIEDSNTNHIYRIVFKSESSSDLSYTVVFEFDNPEDRITSSFAFVLFEENISEDEVIKNINIKYPNLVIINCKKEIISKIKEKYSLLPKTISQSNKKNIINNIILKIDFSDYTQNSAIEHKIKLNLDKIINFMIKHIEGCFKMAKLKNKYIYYLLFEKVKSIILLENFLYENVSGNDYKIYFEFKFSGFQSKNTRFFVENNFKPVNYNYFYKSPNVYIIDSDDNSIVLSEKDFETNFKEVSNFIDFVKKDNIKFDENLFTQTSEKIEMEFFITTKTKTEKNLDSLYKKKEKLENKLRSIEKIINRIEKCEAQMYFEPAGLTIISETELEYLAYYIFTLNDYEIEKISIYSFSLEEGGKTYILKGPLHLIPKNLSVTYVLDYNYSTSKLQVFVSEGKVIKPEINISNYPDIAEKFYKSIETKGVPLYQIKSGNYFFIIDKSSEYFDGFGLFIIKDECINMLKFIKNNLNVSIYTGMSAKVKKAYDYQNITNKRIFELDSKIKSFENEVIEDINENINKVLDEWKKYRNEIEYIRVAQNDKFNNLITILNTVNKEFKSFYESSDLLKHINLLIQYISKYNSEINKLLNDKSNQLTVDNYEKLKQNQEDWKNKFVELTKKIIFLTENYKNFIKDTDSNIQSKFNDIDKCISELNKLEDKFTNIWNTTPF